MHTRSAGTGRPFRGCFASGSMGSWTLWVLLWAWTELAVASLGDFDVKEQVRQAVDIVDLVGQYIPLRRQGRMYVGLCPWHDDTHPSLQVHPQRQTFRCWVCDIGGDVFSILMRMEGLSFPEALAQLAQTLPNRYGRHLAQMAQASRKLHAA